MIHLETCRCDSGRIWLRCFRSCQVPSFIKVYGMICSRYPLVRLADVYITMKNRRVQWENPLFLWPFSIPKLFNHQRVYNFACQKGFFKAAGHWRGTPHGRFLQWMEFQQSPDVSWLSHSQAKQEDLVATLVGSKWSC